MSGFPKKFSLVPLSRNDFKVRKDYIVFKKGIPRRISKKQLINLFLFEFDKRCPFLCDKCKADQNRFESCLNIIIPEKVLLT